MNTNEPVQELFHHNFAWQPSWTHVESHSIPTRIEKKQTYRSQENASISISQFYMLIYNKYNMADAKFNLPSSSLLSEPNIELIFQ